MGSTWNPFLQNRPVLCQGWVCFFDVLSLSFAPAFHVSSVKYEGSLCLSAEKNAF